MLNDFFEKIYCINLERRPDRKEKAIEHFNKIGIDVEFIDAVDGNNLVDLKTNLKPGEIGCVLSHIKVYEKAIKDSIGNYLVIEDDCEFDANVQHLFSEYYKQVPDDWCLLYFGGNHNHTEINKISENIHKLHKTYTTHCYAVRSGFSHFLKEYISKQLNDYEQVDVELSKIQIIKPCYGMLPI